MASLAEQICELVNPKPLSTDPEDDIYEDTKARLVDRNDESDPEGDTETGFEVGRKKMLSLEGMGSAYQGKVVPRKDAVSDSEDGSSHEAENFSGDGGSLLEDLSDNNDDKGSESDDDIKVEDMAAMDEEIYSDEADFNIHSAQRDVDSHTKQKATRNQIRLWESMLEARIKCQKTLSVTNQLPQCDKKVLFKDQVGISYDDTAKILNQLLVKWCELERELKKQNTQFSSALEQEDCSRKRKLKSIQDWDEAIGESTHHMQTHRNKVLKLWYDKTRLNDVTSGSSKFSSFERSTVNQIEDILKDQDRLIKRTQLKRSSYRILGTAPKETAPCTPPQICNEVSLQKLEVETPEHSSHLKEFDGEIFDDDDFYHQLLRQLIEQKASAAGGSSDPVELTRQWLKIQRLRSKTRKNVDTKASKGRKIRYEIHKKLVSFMAPDDRSTLTDEARNRLFRSLFGKMDGCDT